MTPVKRRDTALSLPEYALKSNATNQLDKGAEELDYLRFGFFGEVGGLLSAVKRSVRDQLNDSRYQLASEELGDALWYLFGVAKNLDIKPDDLGIECIKVLRKRVQDKDTAPNVPITFRHIDGVLDSHRGGWDITRTQQLGVLASCAGVLVSSVRDQLKTMSQPTAIQHLGRILAEWALVCNTFDLKAEDIANDNLAKTANRWPAEQQFHPFFDLDDDYPEYERLPREFSIEFIERVEGGRSYVVQRLHGVNIGDRLTDNSNEPDHYRFHDVFHLAYVAYLGWSPVLRSLLKLKRKSRPKIDENEDGARAMIIEEGIATWIFNYAKSRDHYQNVTPGKLDYSLLKQIKSMVEGYEVEACPLWQWEIAILNGFEVFRKLKENRGGRVTVNMNTHTLIYVELSQPT